MTVKERLEYLRGEIEAEQISYGELAELESLAEHIEPGDVQLLEWAGVPEFPKDRKIKVKWTASFETEVVVGPGDDLDDLISDIDITQEGYVEGSFEVKMNKHGLES